ncbi:MAG: cysteine desulfurase family protein [Pseudanabaenaceae cyanobacterium bins.68]|nr:cysteine desulfurase family protein [Pseudanabaenaceae cyanobacterium bins.68]
MPWDQPIYLDHGATTPPHPQVIAWAAEVMASAWGNPASIHGWGERSAMVMERSRLQVAALINCQPEQIVFTSGGTEANNLAIWGKVWQYSQPQHLITSQVEHAAIAQPMNFLARQGWQVTKLAVNSQGLVAPQELAAALQPNTVLVSIIYGQNEVGSLQPIAELAKICQAAQVPFHTDAVQVVGRLPLDLQALPVDMLSLSGHKFYGIPGAGALFCRYPQELVPLLQGGGQEIGLRSGTQPLAAIAALGLAADLAKVDLRAEAARLGQLRDQMWAGLSEIPQLRLTGATGSDRLPHHLSFCQAQLNGREVVRRLNQARIGASSGSACSSGKISPSPVLLAMGFDDQSATGSTRLTLGRSTTAAELEHTVKVLKDIFS